MLNLGLVIAGYAICWYVCAVFQKKSNLIQSLVIAAVSFFFSHVLISGCLFWMDVYTIQRALLLCIVFWSIPTVISILKRQKAQIVWEWRRYMLPLIICILSFPFVMRTAEFYGMGQDEGVFQTQAILFMQGITEREYVFEDYELLETMDVSAEYLDYYLEGISPVSLVGAYSVTEQLRPAINDHSVVFHGLSTYSALMALCGSILGMRHMGMANIFLYDLIIFMMAEICYSLKLKKWGIIIAELTTALSPLVIWITKSALTEAGQTLIVLTILYLLLQRNSRSIVLSGLCILVYSFWHISVFVSMPFFVLFYLYHYIRTGNKAYLWSDLIAVVGYLVGFTMEITISYRYTMGNYMNQIRVIPTERLMLCLIIGACIWAIVITLFLGHMKVDKKIPVRSAAMGIRIMIILSILYLFYSLWKRSYSIMNIQEMVLVAYVMLAGLVGPICVYMSVLFFTKRWVTDENNRCLLLFFLYYIVILGCFMKKDVEFYYYFARYLTMYIPILAIMCGVIVSRHGSLFAIMTIVVELVFFAPYDVCLLRYKDDTKIEWQTLEQITCNIDEEDILLMGRGEFMCLYFPIKALTGAKIYPIYGELDQQMSEFSAYGDHVYCLEMKENPSADQYVLVTSGINAISMDNNVKYEDYKNPYHSRITHLPLKFEQTSIPYILYRYDEE